MVGRALECGCHGTLRLLIGIVGAQSRRRCHQWRCLRWCLLVMLAAWRSSLSVPGTVGRSSSSLAAPDLEGHRTRSTSRHRWPRLNPRSDERQAGNGEVDGSGRGCGGATAGRTRSRGLSRQGGALKPSDVGGRPIPRGDCAGFPFLSPCASWTRGCGRVGGGRDCR